MSIHTHTNSSTCTHMCRHIHTSHTHTQTHEHTPNAHTSHTGIQIHTYAHTQTHTLKSKKKNFIHFANKQSFVRTWFQSSVASYAIHALVLMFIYADLYIKHMHTNKAYISLSICRSIFTISHGISNFGSSWMYLKVEKSKSLRILSYSTNI